MGPKKKKKMNNEHSISECIIHFEECKPTKLIKLNDERMEKINMISVKRQSQPAGSKQRFNNICHQIPEPLTKDHGYHR